jgi:inorganic pyrophosphatase
MDPNYELNHWNGRTINVVIDRPFGSTHPRHPDIVYPINYGYIPGTMAPDGHPIDAYVLGAEYPLERCSAKVIAVIHRRDDVEDKLVVAMSGEWDRESIERATEFQEQYFDSWVELPTKQNQDTTP